MHWPCVSESPSKADFLRGASLLAGMRAPAQAASCDMKGRATSRATGATTAGIVDKENICGIAGTRPALRRGPKAAQATKKEHMKQASPVALRTRHTRRAGTPV